MSNHLETLAPPHSLEAEQSVIGALLMNNDAVDRIGSLKVAHFYREDHRAIFTEIHRCISKGQPADVITVLTGLQDRGSGFLEGLLAYLTQIVQNTPSTASIARYAAIVVDRAKLRALLQATSKADELTRNPKGQSADQVLDAVQSMIAAVEDRCTSSGPRMISDVLLNFIEGATRRAEGEDSAIPTGIESLDRMLNGGLRGGQLVIAAGRPSMGKSALCTGVGLNIAKTHSVLMFSMEMSDQEIGARALADRGGVPLSRVLGKINESDSSTWERMTYGCAQLQPIRFGIDQSPALTLLQLRVRAKAWKRRHGLDVLIVDYLGLMTGGEGEKRHEQIGSYSRGLKALAKELDVAIIALAQLNRKSEDRPDRKPMLADLRDSGEIEQDADIVMFVHRPEMYDPNNALLRGYAELLIRKQRNGALGDIPLHFDGPTCRFSEWRGALPAINVSKARRSGGFD